MDNSINKCNLISRQEDVKKYAEAFDICFRKEHEDLEALFQKQLSNDIVERRVRKLNAAYHTRLSNKQIESIVKYLLKEGDNLENVIKSGNDCQEVVKRIATCGENNSFSFATKYCRFVAPCIYPMYDSLVAFFGKTVTIKYTSMVQTH